MTNEKFDLVGFIMDYETGYASEEDVIAGFQEMIDSGVVWGLQGSYGRAAAQLIELGYCTDPRDALEPEEIAFQTAKEESQ